MITILTPQMHRGVVLGLVIFVGFAVPLTPRSWAQQDSNPVDALLEKARSGSPPIRPQAARRLVNLGTPAAERIHELCQGSTQKLARLGAAVVEVVGEFEHDALRTLLWDSLEDRDFPWRPAAARSLAMKARSKELDRFRMMLKDPLAAVRVAGLQALQILRAENTMLEALAGLTDSNDRVRRQAAILLDDWGHSMGLWYVLEDLRRTDRFFSNQTGKSARYESLKVLEKRLGDRFGYQPSKPPNTEENLAALERLTQALRETTQVAPPELPNNARAGQETPGDVLGLELRSCRRGEYFQRWNKNDVLYVGTGNSRRIDLPEGTVTALLASVSPLLEPLGAQRMWGEPGCDLEQIHRLDPDTNRVVTYRVSKGPDATENLRPEPLSAWVGTLLQTIPATESELLDDLHEALRVLGGPITP